MMKKINLGIVGVTGLVGNVLLKVLEEYEIPIDVLKVFASSKSVGKEIEFNNEMNISKNIDLCINGLGLINIKNANTIFFNNIED